MVATQAAFPTAVTRKRDGWRDYTHVDCEVSPDSRFHFSLVLPIAWPVKTALPIDLSTDAPMQLAAAFVRNGRQRGRIEVSVLRLTRDVAPADWLELFVEQLGETVIRQRWFPSPCGPIPDILSREETRGGVFVSRRSAFKDGDAMFVVACRARESEYAEYADDFLTALTTFRLLHPLHWPFAEPVHALDWPDEEGVRLLLLKSWRIERDRHADSRVAALRITNELDGTPIGMMSVAAVARAAASDPQALVATYVRELQRSRVGVNSIPLKSYSPRGPFDAVWEGRVEALHHGKALNVRLFIGRNERMWFVAGLTGPARSTSRHAWLLNTRGWDVLVGNLS